MKRIVPILFALLYLFSSFGAWAKGSNGVKPPLVKSSLHAAADPKKEDCKLVSKPRNAGQTVQHSRKAKQHQAYHGPIEFLANLFPVLFNFTIPDEPVCVSVISKQKTYYTHAPPAIVLTSVLTAA